MNIITLILETSKDSNLSFDEVFTDLYNYGICDEFGNLTEEFLNSQFLTFGSTFRINLNSTLHDG